MVSGYCTSLPSIRLNKNPSFSFNAANIFPAFPMHSKTKYSTNSKMKTEDTLSLYYSNISAMSQTIFVDIEGLYQIQLLLILNNLLIIVLNNLI